MKMPRLFRTIYETFFHIFFQLSPSPSMNSIMSVGSSMLSMIGRDPGTIPELSFAFREQHFLVGELLCELKNSFDTKLVFLLALKFCLVKWDRFDPGSIPELHSRLCPKTRAIAPVLSRARVKTFWPSEIRSRLRVTAESYQRLEKW